MIDGDYVRMLEDQKIIEALKAENVALKAKCARLEAPVSDEEEDMWAQELIAGEEGVAGWAFSKGSIFNILAARANPPAQKEQG